MRWWKAKTRRMIQSSNKPEKPKNEVPSVESTGYFTGDFDHDLKLAKTAMENNSDVHFREFNLGRTGIRAAIVFVEMLADQDLIDKHIMKSLMDDFSKEYKIELSSLSSNVTDLIKKQILSISGVSEVNHVNEVVPEVLSGAAMLLIDGSAEVLLLGTVKRNTRNIEEPVSESLVRGARVGFTETIGTNTALLRQHGKNQNLSMVQFQVGKRAVKNLVVAYIKDIAEPGLVEEVKKRIEKIDIDDVLESGFVEQLIEDNYLSPFPQVQSTERLDRVMSALMEGRVAILLDGTPFVLIVPVTFSMLLQSPEDYYERWLPSSLIRIMRIGAAMISLLGPALYISFISFHPGLIPSELAISITGTRVGVPFPSLIEALIMEVAIEILREAGLRLPKPIGPAMGIVGGIIIGEAAVQAGIVSPIMVIVVAVTAISSFAIPQYSAGISLR
ncbi:spore germination protein, partial [Bacillus licheniformis]|uniref:spore germination protein n=1 Tax=Bacillus licheniformis TaxID=1402 RepID=UPI000BA53BC9